MGFWNIIGQLFGNKGEKQADTAEFVPNYIHIDPPSETKTAATSTHVNSKSTIMDEKEYRRLQREASKLFSGTIAEYTEKFKFILDRNGISLNELQLDQADSYAYAYLRRPGAEMLHLYLGAQYKYLLIYAPFQEVRESCHDDIYVCAASNHIGCETSRVFVRTPDDLEYFEKYFLAQYQLAAKELAKEKERQQYGYPLLDEYVVIDIETTGLDRNRDQITELAAAICKDGKIVKEYSQLVNPMVSIPPEITRLTGISNSMVKNCPSIRAALPSFHAFISGYPIIAHNASFDMGFLRTNYNRFMSVELPYEEVDTLQFFRWNFDFPNYKLGTISATLGVAHNDAHRALGDCRALAQCYEIAKQKLRTQNQ